ncbi:hypothetical protein [Streptomyces halobius]|uniref:Uncharacterized protein n=1 Tax=Streptomyces halobius TaxID=2879846 RepID=A0ABY4M1N4_9ACTN|nr:hypothetical protein [Streptomyces halobius]UQA91671.1 hypothetical protein K9S39_07155 [Streptomyces halobius]
MNKRELAAVAAVLGDQQNECRTAEEVAALAIEALDETRSRSHRLAVVGQIRFGPQEMTHTVILGPFSSRGVLDNREKFLKAVQGGTAARDAGQHLAWDAKTGTGTGRFMLVPAFTKPRDAWDFYRPSGHGEETKQLTSKMLLEGGWREAKGAAALRAELEAWQPGLWAEQHAYEPACVCGAGERTLAAAKSLKGKHGVPTGRCQRHPDAA